MAGLVLAFACEQELYPFAKGAAYVLHTALPSLSFHHDTLIIILICSEIEICISLMHNMSARYAPRRHCHSAISTLRIMLNDLREQFDDGTSVSTKGQHYNASPRTPLNIIDSQHARKRQKLSGTNLPSPQPSPLQPAASLPELTADIPLPDLMSTKDQPYSWTTDPALFPDTNDVFGQISWEALFQDDGFGTVQGGSVGDVNGEWMVWDFGTMVE